MTHLVVLGALVMLWSVKFVLVYCNGSIKDMLLFGVMLLVSTMFFIGEGLK